MDIKSSLVGAGAVVLLAGGAFGAAAMANAGDDVPAPAVTVSPNIEAEKVAAPVVTPEPQPVVVVPEPAPAAPAEPAPEVVVPKPVPAPAPKPVTPPSVVVSGESDGVINAPPAPDDIKNREKDAQPTDGSTLYPTSP